MVAALNKPKGKSDLDYWTPSVPVSKKIFIFQEMFHKNQGICNYEIFYYFMVLFKVSDLSIHCYVSLYIYIVLLLLYLYKVLLNGYFHKYKPEMWLFNGISYAFYIARLILLNIWHEFSVSHYDYEFPEMSS